ncbi:hypothetical protein GQ457_13G009300 [Hibiscus cannabinus]
MHFKAFQDEGIEPEFEHKMEQLFGVSVAQGILKFTLVMDCSQHASVGYNQYECVDEMTSENITFTCGETNEKWQENWNDRSPRSSHIHSPQSNEHETFGGRGSKRTNESEVLGSLKSAKVDSTRRIGGAVLLTEKLDIMVEAITQRNKINMDLMKLEVHGHSSDNLVDSLAKLVSMPNLIPDMDLHAKCNGSRERYKEDNEFWDLVASALVCLYLHYIKYIHKESCFTSLQTGEKWVHEVFCGHEKRCFNMFRMTQNTFR